MELGSFSLSLAVKDIRASKDFYEKLGFRQILGDIAEGWAMMSSGSATIGLFQGMFDKNILTFNPSLDRDGNPVVNADIRTIHDRLKQAGAMSEAIEINGEEGFASLTLKDPDGNPILIDQSA